MKDVKEQVLARPLKDLTLLRRTLVYGLLSTIGFAQPLLSLYGSNIAVFTTAGFEGGIIVWFALSVLLLPVVFLVLLDVILSNIFVKHQIRVHYLLVGIVFGVVLSAVFNSVSLGYWLFDIALIFLISSAFVMTYRRVGVLHTWLVTMSPLLLGVFIVFVVSTSAVISPPAIGRASTSNSSNQTVRTDSSVLWILLDEAPLWPLLSLDGTINANRFPGFAALAESSTWYRNATTSAQLTVNAVPSILSGLEPAFDRQPVLADFPNNVFTAFNGQKRVDASEEVTALCPRDVCVEPVGQGWDDVANVEVIQRGQRAGFGSFLKDALVVSGHKTLPRDLRGFLPAIDEAWGGFGSKILPTSSDGAVQGDANVIERAKRLQSLIDRAVVSTQPTFHFTHVLLPHRPWALTPDLRVAPTPVPDNRPVSSAERKRDTYQSLLRQYVALDSIIGDMVSKLKASDNWNRTMVIVTSDHGATFVPGESIRNTVNPQKNETLQDIYRVPLFIKYPDQNGMKTDDCGARTTDVLATIFASTGVNPGWQIDGRDLLLDCMVASTQTVWWPEGKAQINASFPLVMERVVYYDAWVGANGGVASIVQSGRSGSLVGTKVPDLYKKIEGLTWTLDGADWYLSVGDKPFSMVPNRATGRVRTRELVSPDIDGLIVMGGMVVGVVSELSGLRPSGAGSYFASVLLTEKIAAGAHSPELWTVDWTGEQPHFGRVGPAQK